MPSLPATTILCFGLTSFLAGLGNLVSSHNAISTFNQPASAITVMNGNALAAIAMGFYYTLAAYQENFAFFACTMPMRLLTALVFWDHSDGVEAWKWAAMWEGGGAVITALALVWEGRWRSLKTD